MKRIFYVALLLVPFLSCENIEIEPIYPQPSNEIVENDDFNNLKRESYYRLTEEAVVSPTVVRGGVGDVVTITGSGFGDVKHRLVFGWGDTSAGVVSNILSWTDTKITANVPGWARSGQVIVVKPDDTRIGANDLKIRWGVYESWYTLDNGQTYIYTRARHKLNQAMVIRPVGNVDLAKLQEAMDIWCSAVPGGIDWVIGDPYHEYVQGDGVSIVDYGYSPGCASVGTLFDRCGDDVYMVEHSMHLDECRDLWVIVHELGHWLGISHNYSGEKSVMKTTGGGSLGAVDIEAASSQMEFSRQQGNCGIPLAGSDCAYNPPPDPDPDPEPDPDPTPNYVQDTNLRYDKKNNRVKITTNGFFLDSATLLGVTYNFNSPNKIHYINISLSRGNYPMDFMADGVEYSKVLSVKGGRK
jgi:hypothetical protein